MRRRTQTILAAAFVVILIGGVAALALWRERSARAAAQSSLAQEGGFALSGPSMGSTWMVRLPRLPAGASPQTVQSAVQGVLDSVEDHMSTYRPKSDLSRFNEARSTDWIPVPEDVARVVDTAQQVADQTGGAFDVTVGPLVNLWGFGPIHPAGPFGTIPTEAMIQEARKHVGYHLLDVRLSPAALRKSDPLVYVDLSGIAKGFAAEQVARRLEQMGITDYLIAVGGEMRAHGHSQAGRNWRVGIETPTPGVRRVLYQVELRTGSLSTSGDYRNFFDSGGRRYCHEIDPSTGQPVLDPPASVSVADPSGAYADAMATALMVLGADKGYMLAEQKGLAVLFITRRSDHFETRATPAFQTMLVGSGN
jgi:thiamine biosynthesis lipoprotein